MQALLGYVLYPATWDGPGAVSHYSLGLAATMRNAGPAPDAPPEPGAFIVVARAEQFDTTGDDIWLPATTGGWGTHHLGLSHEYGTVISAERTKDAPVNEEEDAHGIIAKAVIGSERQSLTVRCRLRLGKELNTGDSLIIKEQTWYAHTVSEIWAEAEWAELTISLRRWPTLTRIQSFDAQTLSGQTLTP